VNCIRVPCAPSHTEIGNSPQPRLWNEVRAFDRPPKKLFTFEQLSASAAAYHF
jgi:hypothetical protein